MAELKSSPPDERDASTGSSRGGHDPKGGTSDERGAVRRAARVNPSEIHDRLAIFVVRALFFFIAASLGWIGTKVIGEASGRSDLNPAIGVLIACGVALLAIIVESVFARSPIRTISAITFGLLMGLVLSLVFQSVVAFILEAWSEIAVSMSPAYQSLLSFLHVVTTTLFCYFGVTLLLQTKDDFKFIIPYVEFRKGIKARTPLVVDTSCFIDGRLHAILATRILDNRLTVPTFVLQELQTLADSSQRSTRERGRRGMDILREIESEFAPEIIDLSLEPDEDVDAGLIRLAKESDGKILTTDYNLQKAATLQGLPVVNINDLATALKPTFVPGENIEVRLLREGDEKKQAVGFLRDGTMVVVEDAKQCIGQTVSVDVTSSLQTHAGRMVFGRLRPSERE